MKEPTNASSISRAIGALRSLILPHSSEKVEQRVSSSTILPYVAERIRRPVPPNACVVPGSTPVVAFGEFRRATVATLGLNPSRIEFLDHHGLELTGTARRLATFASLGVRDLASASSSAVAQVLADCDSYFQRRPYMRWFGQLVPILAACGASYQDGTACHLDLVQWATDPTWAKLEPASLRRQLVADDAAFLLEQLKYERIKLLLVNGNGVWSELRCSDVQEHEPISGLGWRDIRIFTGMIEQVRVIGWSVNLQSSPGVTNRQRCELARRVGSLA